MFKKFINQLLIVAVFSFSAVANGDSGNEKSAAETLASLIANLTTYQADFEQSVSNEYGKQIDFSSGSFWIKKPKAFRWEIKQQFEQLIIADGEHLWTYDKDLEQVTIQNQTRMLADSPLLLLTSDAEGLEESFDISLITPEQAGKNDRLFEMKPKNSESVFESVHVLFQQNQLIELLMKDNLGQQTTVKFSNVKLNKKLGRALFTFTIPEGVDVVDSREQVFEAPETNEKDTKTETTEKH